MRKFILATVSAVSLTAGGALYADGGQAAPLFDGLQGAGAPSNIENVQLFFFGSHRYCWYWDGWHGPGWYWCDYQWRRGFGWGGGEGFRGWAAPGGGRGGRGPSGGGGGGYPPGGGGGGGGGGHPPGGGGGGGGGHPPGGGGGGGGGHPPGGGGGGGKGGGGGDHDLGH